MGTVLLGAALLLFSIGVSYGDDPFHYERKMQGRTAWARNDVTVDNTVFFQPAAPFRRRMEIQFPIALPSQAVFQTVLPPDQLPVQANPSTNANVNLLQQLLKVVPAAAEESKYDKCNHPFHSWLCNRSQPAPATTTTTFPPEVIPEGSFNDQQLLQPDAEAPQTTLPPPPPPPLLSPRQDPSPKKGWDEADSCSHPFHSWLCVNKAATRKLSPPVPVPRTEPPAIPVPFTIPPTSVPTIPEETVVLPDASNPEENLLLPVTESTPATVASTTTTTTTTTRATTTVQAISPSTQPSVKKTGWDEGADSCSHAFHSWLCAKPAVRTTPTTPIKPTTPTERTLPPIGPDASNNEDTILVPDLIIPPTTTSAPPRIPSSTSPPQPPLPRLVTTPKTLSPRPSGWDAGVDPCTHAFHSWLCAKPKARPTTVQVPRTSTMTTPPLIIEPVEQELPDSSKQEENIFLPAEDVTTTTTSTTTTTTTTTTTPPPVPPSFPPSTQAPPVKKGWDESDSCSHPFHSWLCSKAPGRKAAVPSSTPPAEIQPNPDSSNLGEVLLQEPAVTTTTTSTQRTVPSATTPNLRTAQPPKPSWDGQDPCSHPFHSWLCRKAPGRTLPNNPQTPPPPLIPEVQPNPDSSNFGEVVLAEPVTTTKSATTTTTTRPTFLPTVPLQRSTAAKAGWEGQDPCSHPFHSWLCRRSKTEENIENSSRFQRHSASAAVYDEEYSLDDVAAWESFESKRVHPLAKEARVIRKF